MTEKKIINLALQGGGAHGAFTWGVLDRLLEEERLEIAAISGTSAGALNGAALKAGLLEGGRSAARDNLDWLWEQMGAVSGDGFAAWWSGLVPDTATLSKMMQMSPVYQLSDAATRVFSPYAFGPAYRNPLERIAQRFHYEKVCAGAGPRLFVGATNVRTGKIRVFSGDDICTEVLLASACLPSVFQAVEIDDAKTGQREAYWDGGYTGNPALFPLYAPELPADILLVNINPLRREEVPKTPAEIQNRVNEIGFNSALMGELRAISFVKRLLAEGRIPEGSMKDMRVHMIADDDLMTELSVATKLIPAPPVMQRLKAAGRAAAERFLGLHWDALGRRDTLNLSATFG